MQSIAVAVSVSTLDHEQLLANQLSTGETPHTLKLHVKTRFNSHKNLFKSVYDSRLAIENFCAARYDEPFSRVILERKDELWPFLQKLLLVLELFDGMTLEASSEDATGDMIVSLYLRLRMSLENMYPDSANHLVLAKQGGLRGVAKAHAWTGSFVHFLKSSVDEKMEPLDHELVAFVLNPYNHVRKDTQPNTQWNFYVQKGYDLLKAKLANVEESQNQDKEKPIAEASSTNKQSASGLPQLDSDSDSDSDDSPAPTTVDILREFHTYISLIEVLKVSKKRNPNATPLTVLQWWASHSHDLKCLAELARKYLALSPSQIASERNFSALRLSLNHLRTSLNPDKVFKISVVRSLLRRQYRKTKSERSDTNIAADTKRNESRKATRIAGLMERLANVAPDPQLQAQETVQAMDITSQAEDEPVDDGERSDDEDYMPSSDPEDAGSDFGGDDDEAPDLATAFSMALPPAPAGPTASGGYETRSRPFARLVSTIQDRYRFVMSFHNLKGRPVPNLEQLFGAKQSLFSNCVVTKAAESTFYFLTPSEDAIKTFKRPKKIIDHLGGPIISLSQPPPQQ